MRTTTIKKFIIDVGLTYQKYAAMCNGTSSRRHLFIHRSTVASNRSDTSLKERQAELMARGLPKRKPLPGVNSIVLVVSSKGGVGKSTTAVNLATALAVEKSYKVGILDADVFGPSIPLMMNLSALSPDVNKDNKMIPLENYNVKCMSMGFLVSETSSVVWRGLMVMKALEQMTRQVDWSDIDCLIVDTPPGTGDTLLSLIQSVPVAGVVLVTTPEKLAVQVARRGGLAMKKLDIPIIGIISNMNSVECSNCHTDILLFGRETRLLAEDLGVPILADIPFFYDESQGSFKPAVVDNPKGLLAKKYLSVAERVKDFILHSAK